MGEISGRAERRGSHPSGRRWCVKEQDGEGRGVGSELVCAQERRDSVRKRQVRGGMETSGVRRREVPRMMCGSGWNAPMDVVPSSG